MALVMACRSPKTWAGVSAACPITDLAAWYAFCDENRFSYAEHMRACFGGPPDDAAREAEYHRRSPLYCLDSARGVSIDIQTGVLDGHGGRAVPVDHALRAFNVLAGANGLYDRKLSEEEIGFIRGEAKIPSSLESEPRNEPGRRYPVLFLREAGPVRIVLYDGGHDFDTGAGENDPPALTWLSNRILEK